MTTAQEVNDAAHEIATKQLQDRIAYGKHFHHTLLVQDANGEPILVTEFVDTDDEAKVNWREVLLFMASVAMAGFARAEYVTFVSDVWVKHASEMDEDQIGKVRRGDFQRAVEAGDETIGSALLVTTYGRSGKATKLNPYYVNKKKRVRFTDEDHDEMSFGGYMERGLERAATGPRVTDKLKEMFDAKTLGELWGTIAIALFDSLDAEAQVRAHADIATLRFLLGAPETQNVCVSAFFPESPEVREIIDDGIARISEWNETLVTAKSPEEMVEKLRVRS
jgi:hypothetical protein